MIVCGAAHVAHVEADLAAAALDDALILVEPGARNTAPAIALPARAAGPAAVLLVLPAHPVLTDAPASHVADEARLTATPVGALAEDALMALNPSNHTKQ